MYYDAPPVKELRKKFKLKKMPGVKPLLAAVLKAYKEFGGKNKRPNIAVVEFRQPVVSSESALLAEFFSREGMRTEVVSPDQLEYRNDVLHRGEFTIDPGISPHSAARVPGPLRSVSSHGARE